MRHAEVQWLIAGLWGGLVRATLLLILGGHVAAQSPIRHVNVTYDGATYFCDVFMQAPVPPAVAWDVLTDFEHMAEWVPNVRESRVMKQENNTVMVEQRGMAKFGVALLPFTTHRVIEMNKPTAIRSTQVKGSFGRVDSLMKLEPDGKGTRLDYHLEVVPGLLAGAILSKSFLEHELAEQFVAIIGEMTRRAP